jgi:hypothetical protein
MILLGNISADERPARPWYFWRAGDLPRDGKCAGAGILYVPDDSADWQGFPKK